MNLKLCSVVVLMTIAYGNAYSQISSINKANRLLDTSALANWSVVTGGAISNDGNYCVYHINFPHKPIEAYNPKYYVTTIKSLKNSWKHEIGKVDGHVTMSENSRYAFYKTGDSLWQMKLGGERQLLENEIADFQLVTIKGIEFLLYKTLAKKVVFRNMKNGDYTVLAGIENNVLNNLSQSFYLVAKNNDLFQLIKFDPALVKKNVIFSGHDPITDLISDENSKRFVFKSNGKWYLGGENGEIKVLDFENKVVTGNLEFDRIERFESRGKLMVLRFNGPILSPLDPSVNPVKVFSYQDAEYYSNTNEKERSRESFLFSYNINADTLTRLEYTGERLAKISENGEFAYINSLSQSSEYYWNRKATNSSNIRNLKTGVDNPVKSRLPYSIMSSNGKYVITQDDSGGDIYVFNTETGKRTNLTNKLPIPEFDKPLTEEPEARYSRGLSFCSWIENDEMIIIYDRYDIWMLDAHGNKLAINLTKGMGRKNHNVFRFLDEETLSRISLRNTSLMITSFNEDTKENGFYSLTTRKPGKLKRLFIDTHFYFTRSSEGNGNWQVPVKAKNAGVWLIPRQSAHESRNLFWTKNFKEFHPITELHPESKINWFTTELVSFKTKDGVDLRAILYKPDNYDPHKKYPVLFNYYQSETQRLNNFIVPRFTDNYFFNYPMMLARGYMVCLTDTYQIPGKTAHCIVDAIEGAADELAKRPYIDSKHYGASGGSFGGYATNCLAALSKKFSALVSISGVSDLVSIYGSVPGLGEEHTENRQMGMAVSLGSDPGLYLKNSPIAYSKDVLTPLLIVSTLVDHNVNVGQGIEYFTSLRREGKPVWLLQYQENGHGIGGLENQKDLYQRMNQFFDYYLKGAPAPVWMTRPQSVNDRGVKDGFEFDQEIKTPEPSQLVKSKD